MDAESGSATARARADAPEIDGEVRLRDAGHLNSRDVVAVEDADEHDLDGVPVDCRAA